jgi:hypothetical protein
MFVVLNKNLSSDAINSVFDLQINIFWIFFLNFIGFVADSKPKNFFSFGQILQKS